jgi:hypothetical protein
MYLILRILKFGILRVSPAYKFRRAINAQFKHLAVRRKKNKKDKNLVSVNRFVVSLHLFIIMGLGKLLQNTNFASHHSKNDIVESTFLRRRINVNVILSFYDS